MPHPQFPNLSVLDHPLIRHKLTILRDKHTTTRDFKQLVNEIAMLMAYEVTKDLPLEPLEVVRRLLQAHPDVPVFAAALDRELNAQGYILPGLGDAGDRLFGTR